MHFPPAFEERMKEQLKGSWDAFVAAHAEPPPVSIRLNPKKKIAYDGEKIPWTSEGLYLKERPVFTLDPLFHAGCYYVQEASSMFLEQAVRQSVDLDQSLRVLDLCAAPGGKSTLLLSLINASSLLVSNEVIRSRSSILSETIQKWGYSNVVVTNSDPEHFEGIQSMFDLVVVDAPCSGEGLFRKEPEAADEWSQDNVQLCAARQKRILAHIWPTLKENGVLIYCTCTYNSFENEENLAWLKQQKDLEFVELKIDPSWGIETINEGGIGYRFYPDKAKGEGFFLSVIRKREQHPSMRYKKDLRVFTKIDKKIGEQLNAGIPDMSNKTIRQFRDTVLLLPADEFTFIEQLTKHLKIVHCGTLLGTLKHDKIIPDQAAALSVSLDHGNFQCFDCTNEEALLYLRKENLQPGDLKKGFTLMRYENIALGWANVLENRINNMYPANWRVRMGGK